MQTLKWSCLLAWLLMFAPTCWSADWPQWLGKNRDGKSLESGLFGKWGEDGPNLLYETQGIGAGYATVSVVGSRLYTTGNLGDAQAVTCIDTQTGKTVWQTKVTNDTPQHGYTGSRSTPTIDKERLYVVASSGAAICLDRETGDLIWQRDFTDWGGKMMSGWGFSESPLIVGERLICTPGGARGIVVALDKTTGTELWACKLPPPSEGERKLNDGAGYSSPILSYGGGVAQIIQLVGRGLIGVRLEDGELLWRYDRVANTTANIPTPVVDGDYVFTSTAYGTGAALLKLVSTGDATVDAQEQYWLESNQFQNKHGGMILIDGHIYSGTGNGAGLPVCVEMKTGRIAWGPERGEGRGESNLVYADGHIIIRRDNGVVMLIEANPERFTIIGSFKPSFQEGNSWAYPVVSGGKLYLREQDRLMVYDIRSED